MGPGQAITPPSLPPRLVFETSAAERKKPVDAAASTTTSPPAEAKAAKRGLPVPLGVDGVDIAFLLFLFFSHAGCDDIDRDGLRAPLILP